MEFIRFRGDLDGTEVILVERSYIIVYCIVFRDHLEGDEVDFEVIEVQNRLRVVFGV